MNERVAGRSAGMTKFRDGLLRAVKKRASLIARKETQAFRIFSAEGLPGVFVDVYDTGAVLIVYEGKAPRDFDPASASATILEALKDIGVRGVYVKRFVKDRSRLGGELPEDVRDATPAAGEALPEAMIIREHNWKLEVRLYDGLSTGLFLDQRENRRFVERFAVSRKSAQVLNTFAYTCAFSIAAAAGGASTTSVDVSPRYLEWGKRNFAHNDLPLDDHRFYKMDTFEFFNYARRKALKYDLIILDPPSFGSGSKRKGIRPWSSLTDYSRLIREASELLRPKGVIFASTNTTELCRPGRLESEIAKGLGHRPRWIDLPEVGEDFAAEQDRFAARAFGV